MREFRIDFVLTFACVVLSAIAVVRWQHALDAVPTVDPHLKTIARARDIEHIAEDSIVDAADVVVANDPFRLSNAPASVAYSPAADGGPSALAQPVVARIRPTLVLKGIIGGPPWQAIVDGIPGQPTGAIIRQGMSFDKLTIRTITRDTVFVLAPDTSWKLTLTRSAP
jgi:hypothetical protein